MLIMLVAGMAITSNAQVAEIQSGIVFYFTKYVEWPASRQSGDFVISVVGDDEITSHLQTMAKAKTVGARKIVVNKVATADAAKGSHIIFLAPNKAGQFGTATQLASSQNALLVTNSKGYGKKGAGINFITKNGKPSYEINQGAISSCGLKISAKLTALGTVID